MHLQIKGADQLRGYHAADQRLSFRYIEPSLYFLDTKFQVSYNLPGVAYRPRFATKMACIGVVNNTWSLL